MSRIEAVNLIRAFDFYLAAMFLFSVLRRWAVYRDGLLLGVALCSRWPRLLARLNQHRAVVLNWPTLRPAALALGLTVAQMIASRLVFPQATIRAADLGDPWWQPVLLGVAFLPMAAIDAYFLISIGRFDRLETEKYFDTAERWAGTWQARAVRVVTFGRVNPDRMVDEQVRDGLQVLGATVVWSMWWINYQILARLGFGLSVWLVWAVR